MNFQDGLLAFCDRVGWRVWMSSAVLREDASWAATSKAAVRSDVSPAASASRLGCWFWDDSGPLSFTKHAKSTRVPLRYKPGLCVETSSCPALARADSPYGTRMCYDVFMTELLTKAFDALSKLPAERQNELAPFLLSLADNGPLTEDEAKAIAEARAENARDGLVPEETVRAFWASLRL